MNSIPIFTKYYSFPEPEINLFLMLNHLENELKKIYN